MDVRPAPRAGAARTPSGGVAQSTWERIASFRTTQGTTSSSRPKTRTSQLTHREGNCVASLRAKREPGAQEAMLEALRQLAEQVRADDSLR